MRTRYRLTGLLGSAAAIVMLLAGTALAQMRPGVNFMTDKPPPSKEEQERQKAVDDAYKNAMQKLPEKKKSADPWEGVRSAPARQGKQ
jgi:Lon protease-like protein